MRQTGRKLIYGGRKKGASREAQVVHFFWRDCVGGIGGCGRVERTPPVFRCALCSLFAPAFRSRECHIIPPCTVVRLPLTEDCLRDYRTSLFMPPFTRRD